MEKGDEKSQKTKSSIITRSKSQAQKQLVVAKITPAQKPKLKSANISNQSTRVSESNPKLTLNVRSVSLDDDITIMEPIIQTVDLCSSTSDSDD